MREIIRNQLLNNHLFNSLIDENNIYTYRVPEVADMQNNLIVYIDLLDVPTPYLYYDGEYHQEEYLTQINCYAPAGSYNDWRKVNQAIKDVMEDSFNWKLQGGFDEFDDDHKIFNYGQRYQGIYKILRRD